MTRDPRKTRVIRLIAATGTFLGKHPWYLVNPDGTTFIDPSDFTSHHFTSQQSAAAYREQLITAKGIKNEKA